MASTINSLRKWAKVRARFASDGTKEDIQVSKEEETPLLKQEKHNPFIN
jgi:hypothetical protein